MKILALLLVLWVALCSSQVQLQNFCPDETAIPCFTDIESLLFSAEWETTPSRIIEVNGTHFLTGPVDLVGPVSLIGMTDGSGFSMLSSWQPVLVEGFDLIDHSMFVIGGGFPETYQFSNLLFDGSNFFSFEYPSYKNQVGLNLGSAISNFHWSSFDGILREEVLSEPGQLTLVVEDCFFQTFATSAIYLVEGDLTLTNTGIEDIGRSESGGVKRQFSSNTPLFSVGGTQTGSGVRSRGGSGSFSGITFLDCPSGIQIDGNEDEYEDTPVLEKRQSSSSFAISSCNFTGLENGVAAGFFGNRVLNLNLDRNEIIGQLDVGSGLWLGNIQESSNVVTSQNRITNSAAGLQLVGASASSTDDLFDFTLSAVQVDSCVASYGPAAFGSVFNGQSLKVERGVRGISVVNDGTMDSRCAGVNPQPVAAGVRGANFQTEVAVFQSGTGTSVADDSYFEFSSVAYQGANSAIEPIWSDPQNACASTNGCSGNGVCNSGNTIGLCSCSAGADGLKNFAEADCSSAVVNSQVTLTASCVSNVVQSGRITWVGDFSESHIAVFSANGAMLSDASTTGKNEIVLSSLQAGSYAVMYGDASSVNPIAQSEAAACEVAPPQTCGCVPSCVDRVCGDDGCGGQCGTCSGAEKCCYGYCTCVANCQGRECGSDGCGFESCGVCASGQSCSNGVCVGEATGELCRMANGATRQCGRGLGGAHCGDCPLGQRCREGVCSCYYDCTERSCGPISAAQGSTCPQSSCGDCPAGFLCGNEGHCSQQSDCSVQVEVRETGTNQLVQETCTVSWNGPVLETGAVQTPPNPFSLSFAATEYGSYQFQSSCAGFLVSNEVKQITSDTVLVTLLVTRISVSVRIVDCVDRQSLTVSSTVSISQGGVTVDVLNLAPPSSQSQWMVPSLGSYVFSSTASGYTAGSQTVQISETTTLVELCLERFTEIDIDIRVRSTNLQIEGSAQVSYSGASAGSFTWNGLYRWSPNQLGDYVFNAVPSAPYREAQHTESVSESTVLIIIYVDYCGDGVCQSVENADICFQDCVALLYEFENADGSGPVNGMRVNYFLEDPRTVDPSSGPNRNSVQADAFRETGTASNIVYQSTYGYDRIIYTESVVTGFINFYWTADVTKIDPALGVFRLRVHVSQVLGATNFNYRFVNTWRPIDAEPAPYAPTDLNLHLFHPEGALDINNPSLISGGFAIGAAVADSKQTGGPATMDISPGANQVVSVWNSKPPRSRAIAPSQAGRYLKDAQSYVVVYGKTSNSASGKQVGEVTLESLLELNPGAQADTSSDLWSILYFSVTSPGQNQPSIVAQNRLEQAEITSTLDMVFDCDIYQHCTNFIVPYSDTGR